MSLTSSNSNRNTTKLRLVFLGDQGVGKSSIIDRYTTSQYDQNHNNTVGIDFNVKDLSRYGQNYRLQMWDTAGQERYRSLIPTYLKNAHCVVHVFEINKRSTLDGIRQWHKLFLQHQQAPGIIVGNKTDLSNVRKVTRQQGQELANQLRLSYFQVSAKTGRKVNQLFEEIVDIISGQRRKEQDQVWTSRQKMKQMKTITQNQEQGAKSQVKQEKKMSLKAKGIEFAKKLKCCNSS